MTFYDRNGKSQFYTADDKHFFDFNGNPLGYLHNTSIYNFKGNHLGWLDNGWIIDPNGFRYCFNEDSSGGPMRPMKKMKALKGIKSIKPIKSIKEIRPIKPIKSLRWSDVELDDFFKR